MSTPRKGPQPQRKKKLGIGLYFPGFALPGLHTKFFVVFQVSRTICCEKLKINSCFLDLYCY